MTTFVNRTALGWAVLCGVVSVTAAQDLPHATHDPRLGGAFAPVASDTLHLEAVWSEQRRIRLFVSQPSGVGLTLERLRDIEAHVRSGTLQSPFVLLEAEGHFEARIPSLTTPATMEIRVRANRGGVEDRVTVTFSAHSPDPTVLGSTPATDIPDTLAGILAALAGDRRDAETHLRDGNFLALLGPEGRIRDRVLAIAPHLGSLSPDSRTRADAAIAAVVRECWLLHIAIDYGDAAQRRAALGRIFAALDRATAVLAGVAK